MKVKCLIVDDEPLAVKLIEKHIAQIDTLEVVATCNSAIKAFEVLNTQQVDLLFLDIKMPALTGIDFLKTLKHPPHTILTTAYRNYALESYDLDVVDYLLKPITFDRFFKAVDRYFRKNQTKPVPQNSVPAPSSEKQYIVVKSGNKHHKIELDTILFVESLKDYVRIHTGDKRIVAKYKISEFEENLGRDQFIRIHRSFIINLHKVTAFTAYDVEVGETEIPIGASYKEKVMPLLKIT